MIFFKETGKEIAKKLQSFNRTKKLIQELIVVATAMLVIPN